MPGLAGPDYRTQGQTTKARPLEVPPDLTRPIGDDRFVVPDLKATTYSQYTRDRSGQPVVASNSSVLPRFDSARIVRNGDQHWLVVKGAPDKLWPAVREFWIESGFIMRRETPEAGVMETDWAEDRSKIPQDAVRNTVGRLLDGLYSSGERDKFRTRLDLGTEPGTTEIFVSHRGLEEYYSNPDQLSTAWRFRPTDKTLEFEMLSRLMVKLGAAADRPTAVASTVTAPSTQARATYDKQGSGPLVVNEAFDRSWRRVGLALDRSGFTVEDRDRSKGTFFVRYIDPEQDAKSPKAKGWLDRLAFWRDDAPAERLQLRIKVTESGSNSLVEVQGADGKPDSSATAKRILALLYDQLR
jgi:outer membrane protein assembly factor BamC